MLPHALHTGGALGIRFFEPREALSEPEDVGRPDGEDADAALRATRPTEKVRAASDGGIGEGTVDQGDKVAVLSSEACIWIACVCGIAAHDFHGSQFVGRAMRKVRGASRNRQGSGALNAVP